MTVWRERHAGKPVCRPALTGLSLPRWTAREQVDGNV
jgi:hypothetical protein